MSSHQTQQGGAAQGGRSREGLQAHHLKKLCLRKRPCRVTTMRHHATIARAPERACCQAAPCAHTQGNQISLSAEQNQPHWKRRAASCTLQQHLHPTKPSHTQRDTTPALACMQAIGDSTSHCVCTPWGGAAQPPAAHFTPGAQAGSVAVCAQHANSHIHTTNALHAAVKWSLSNQSLGPMQHTGIPGSSTRGGNHPPVHTHTDTPLTHPYAGTYMRKKLLVHVKAARLLGVCCVSAAGETQAF
jgi:hypothetical protein